MLAVFRFLFSFFAFCARPYWFFVVVFVVDVVVCIVCLRLLFAVSELINCLIELSAVVILYGRHRSWLGFLL